MDLFEVVTVGFPFCAFKLIAGSSLLGAGAPPARLLGVVLIALGALDAVVNALNFVALTLRGRRAVDACALALAARALRAPEGDPDRWSDLGAAFDVLVSFALVALMIAAGRIAGLPAPRLAAWNAAVILNVLGAGLGRVGTSLSALRR